MAIFNVIDLHFFNVDMVSDIQKHNWLALWSFWMGCMSWNLNPLPGVTEICYKAIWLKIHWIQREREKEYSWKRQSKHQDQKARDRFTSNNAVRRQYKTYDMPTCSETHQFKPQKKKMKAKEWDDCHENGWRSFSSSVFVLYTWRGIFSS